MSILMVTVIVQALVILFLITTMFINYLRHNTDGIILNGFLIIANAALMAVNIAVMNMGGQ